MATQHQYHEQPRLDAVVPPLSVQTHATPLTSAHLKRNDEYDLSSQSVSPIMSRRTSIDSDRYSTVSGLNTHYPSNPIHVSPAPAYVAQFGASQVVSEHEASTKRRPSIEEESDDGEDDKRSKDDVQFSEAALALVNAFLDQLLYSFLSNARSTSLLALRPAVTEVLKHRLAREAIASAEEELAELLAGGDDEEDMDSKHKAAENSRKWDLELVWKRTRLRVMVYMRLGEMEDDDEQRFVKEEELFHGSERRFSSSTGLVSWTAAIFLTSVLEYVAEQTLQIAGQAAHSRARRQSRTQRLGLSSATQAQEDIVVEEYDVEKVALNSTLGRLWRTWRKALRNSTPTSPIQRNSSSAGRISRENMASALSRRKDSGENGRDGSTASEPRPGSRDQHDELPETQYPEHILAANIPLPIGDSSRDIDEIHVPGLASDPDNPDDASKVSDVPYEDHEIGSHVPLPISDDQRDIDEIEVPGLARDPGLTHDDEAPRVTEPRRRSSFTGYHAYSTNNELPAPESSSPCPPIRAERPPAQRKRSMSVPTSARPLMTYKDMMPGAFPEDDVESEQPPDTDAPMEDQPQPDQKAEHQGGDGDRPEMDRALSDASTKRKSEFPWMAAGAGAGAAAAAAGVSAWSSAPKQEEKKVEPAYEDRFAPQQSNEPSNRRNFGGLIATASQNDGSKDVPDNTKDVPQANLSSDEIDERDRRKSLLDIKSLMAASPSSGQRTPQNEEPQTVLSSIAGADPGESSGKRDPYTLGRDRSVSEEEGPNDATGVAQASGTQVPGVTTSPNEETQAREAGKRPARIVLGETLPNGSTGSDSTAQAERPKTPRQYLDLSKDAQASQTAPEEAQRSSPRTSQRANLANGAQQSPAVEKSPYRQSYSAPVEKNGVKRDIPPSRQSKQSQEQDVQEHPVVQKIASRNSNEPKSATSEKAMPLTSASIRGPEDFDMFVQGADTVKYTLTPETVRDEPASGLVHPHMNETDFVKVRSTTSYSRSGQSPVEMDATSIKSGKQMPSAADSRVGRSQTSKHATSATPEDDARSAKRRSISKPPPRNLSTHRRSGLMAREPRVLTESTRDFADFIRSTGPGKDPTVYPILPNASTTSLHSLRSAHINGASASRSSSPGAEARSRSTTMRSANDEGIVPPVPPIPGRSRTTLQPRGATAGSGGSSELIDFIRSGPDENGKHRISRTVAPFRSTMDSDQLTDLAGRMSSDKPSSSTLNGAPSVQSVRTSANSRTALLNGSSRAVQPPSNGHPSRLSGTYSADPRTKAATDPESGRKQHRNKDPYSMDFLDDDDDEDNLVSTMPNNTRKEESLADFLNEYEPPQDNGPRPVVSPDSAAARNALGKARKNSINAPRSGAATPATVRSVATTVMPRSGYASPGGGRQAVANRSMATSGATTPRMQARGGTKDIAANSNTKDLADFFKSSGPDDTDSAPAPIVGRRPISKEAEKAAKKAEKKKSGGFFGLSRRKHIDVA